MISRIFFCLNLVLYLGLTLVNRLGPRKTRSTPEPRAPLTAGQRGVGADSTYLPVAGFAPTFSEVILTDLLTQWQTIPFYDPEQIAAFFQNMGSWLIQIEDEDVYKRWVLRFAMAIQQKHPGLPLSVCIWKVEYEIQQCAREVLR